MMHNYKEYIIRYHGNLQQVLQGTDIMFDVISERYAIIKTRDKEVSNLNRLRQIEYMEESRPMCQVNHVINLKKKKAENIHSLSGNGVTLGWISHKEKISYSKYNIICLHDGIKEYSENEIIHMKNKAYSPNKDLDMCVGQNGMAPDSELVVVNWQENEFYTADAIRGVRFIIKRSKAKQKPLVIYLPFDISSRPDGRWDLTREIISHMALWGKIIVVSNLEPAGIPLEKNLAITRGPIFSNQGALTVGTLILLMEWGIVRMNEPLLYGQKLRTYYIKNATLWFKENKSYTRGGGVTCIDELLELLIPQPVNEAYRTLDLAYALAPESAEIDAFIIYNHLNEKELVFSPGKANLYPLIFPYLGIRGTVADIKGFLSGGLQTLITGSLAYILGSESLDRKPANFKSASIITSPGGLTGANTLVGIIGTGIDYTNPVFIDSNGETRIVSIWDQTIGIDSPYGYGTIYGSDIINAALKSPDPFEIVPHKDEWGDGTILAGIAAGYKDDSEMTYRGAAPGASIVVVKLLPATPDMQKIYHSEYNPLGFSSLDVARAFEYLGTLANHHQKPISICLPMGTNSGSHDGTNILDTIIMSYAENPGVSVVLASGEEANRGHHASGNLKEKNRQTIKLIMPQGQEGFITEIWASFGDRIEVLLTSPKTELEESVTVSLNKGQRHKIFGSSFVWSQGSKIDTDTGCQVIRFRLENPFKGDWTITLTGLVVIEGIYHIWIPKTGMILPGTVLLPPDPFVTIYNTSASVGLITIGCYDKKSFSPTSSSGRGFARDGRVKPDFVVPGMDIPGPLPGNKWGLVTGTSVASAITVGISSLIYEDELIREAELSNTVTMKATLIDQVKREQTVSYPNPSSGYGLLDITTVMHD